MKRDDNLTGRRVNDAKLDSHSTPARPDEAIHKLTEELHFIVKTGDLSALNEWIKRYVRRIAVSYPVTPNKIAGLSEHFDPKKAAQMQVCAHLGVSVARAAVWSEQTDVEKAQVLAHAELYFLDVLGKMPAPEPERKN